MAVRPIGMRRIRIVVLDDNAVLLEAVVDLLTELEIVEVVGACLDLGHAMDAVRTQRPDAVLLDALLASGGHQATARLCQMVPAPVVIGMSTTANPVLREQLARAGARACVVKDRLPAELPAVLDALQAELDLPRTE